MAIPFSTERNYYNNANEITVDTHTIGSKDPVQFIGSDGKLIAAGNAGTKLAAEHASFTFYRGGALFRINSQNDRDGSVVRMEFEEGGTQSITFGSQRDLKRGALKYYFFETADKLPAGETPFGVEKKYGGGHLTEFHQYTKNLKCDLAVKVAPDTHQVTGTLRIAGLPAVTLKGRGFIDNLDKLDTAELFSENGRNVEKLSGGVLKITDDDGGGLLVDPSKGTAQILTDAGKAVPVLAATAGSLNLLKLTPLIGQDGGGLIGQDGGGLIGQDGGGLIATTSNQLIAVTDGKVIGRDGAGLLAVGDKLIGQDGGGRAVHNAKSTTAAAAAPVVPLSGGEYLSQLLVKLASNDPDGLLSNLSLAKAGSQEDYLDTLVSVLTGQKSLESFLARNGAKPADLVASRVTVDKASGKAGDTIVVKWDVANVGDVALNASKSFAWLSRDAKLGNSDDLLLGKAQDPILLTTAPHADGVGSKLPAGLLPGKYYVIVNANGDGQAREDGTNNQTKPVAFTVLPKTSLPDLAVVAPALGATHGKAGDSVTVQYTLKERSLVAVDASTTQFYLSKDKAITAADTPLGSSLDPKLLPGGSYNGDFSFKVPGNLAAGTCYVGVLANGDGKVGEADRGNNAAALAFTIDPTPINGPDLTAHIAKVSAASVDPGGTITVDYTTSNLGNEPVIDAVKTVYLSKDAKFGPGDVVLASFGDIHDANDTNSFLSNALTIPGTVAPGTYYLGVVADSGNAAAEADEANNASNAVRITVKGPAPDLGFFAGDNAVTVSPKTFGITPGTELEASYYVLNKGQGIAPNSHTGVFVSADKAITPGKNGDILAGTFLTPKIGLQPDNYHFETADFTVPNTLKPGIYYVGVVADYDGKVGEADESNNVSSIVTIVVTAGTNGRIAAHAADSFDFAAAVMPAVSDDALDFAAAPFDAYPSYTSAMDAAAYGTADGMIDPIHPAATDFLAI